MSKSLTGRLLVASAALALAACGGGGGGGSTTTVVSTPPPPAVTTQTCPDGSVIPITSVCPPPPPPPAALSTVFAGVTTSTEFATLGLEAGSNGIPASALVRNGFAVRYDAASNAYIVDLPSTNPGRVLLTGGEDNSFWYGFIEGSGSYFSVFKPSSTNPKIALAYTSYGISSGYYTSEFGFTAFGMATPSSGIPLSGTATYEAIADGFTLNGFGRISGDASLQFNFGSGTLAGHFDPMLENGGPALLSLGRYDFVNTVFGAGSTTFSGGLSRSGISTLGAFDGRFTGPTAQELMARWTAPFIDPANQQPGEMFGVWVGRRQ